MKVACLGWGSLVWCPKDLPIVEPWYKDGPLLPIEFARQSQDGRLTLVITDGATPVNCLWSYIIATKPDDARKTLAKREDTSEKNIGLWQRDSSECFSYKEVIKNWATKKEIDALVWTALPPKFKGTNGRIPTKDEVVEYLRSLEGDTLRQARARKYIEKAPKQINTEYREAIEQTLGWVSSPTMR